MSAMADVQGDASFEVVIIGAGLSGIIAAQRYLQVHPQSRLAILEKDDCVGGVFSRRRLYDEFWTQWTVGLAEFSDMPMPRPPEEDCKNDCFRAKYTTEYLENYVDKMSHGGQRLRERIRFGISVASIHKTADKWIVTGKDSADSRVDYSATKLMVATGSQSSLPNMPDFPGKETFGGAIIHSESFGESNVLSREDIQHIAVIGAGKSSADMIYEAVKAGKTVSWIIRTSGTGAGFFAPLDLPTPYKNGPEAAQTRIMSSLQPCFLNEDNWWTWFLHSTWIGAWLVGWIFSKLDAEVKKRANYHGRQSMKGFEKLDYEPGIFWQNNTGGAVHHADFWDIVAKDVQVYRDEVTQLGNRRAVLGDGTHFRCDAILCGTGWKPGIEFFSEELLVELDVPHQTGSEPPEMTAKWEKLTLEADEKISKKFPILAHPPPHRHKYAETTPYRLYNTLAPLKDDSILFMNHVTAGNKIMVADVQAMWAVAYFDKNIDLPPIEQMEKEVAMWVAWSRRRYLSQGELGNFAAFDSVQYTDRLLKDMGSTAHRKGWWRDLFEPFVPSDLGKAWEEYLDKHGNEGQ